MSKPFEGESVTYGVFFRREEDPTEWEEWHLSPRVRADRSEADKQAAWMRKNGAVEAVVVGKRTTITVLEASDARD